MQTTITVNEAIESLTTLSPDDQLMVADIIRKRVREQRREELAESVRVSREEYSAGTTEHGSVEDFLNSLDEE
jgi:uncharacterized protein YegJ (DUF2314 family)